MEDSIPHLERKKAEDFVANRLFYGLPDDPNDLNWINGIIRAFHNHIPYQNITLLQDKRKTVPSWENIYNDCIVTGKGGLCLSLNVALAAVLSAFGLQCYLVGATYVATKAESVHSIVLLECETSNSQHERSSDHISRRKSQSVSRRNSQSAAGRLKNIYLADVGCGFPTLQVIHLHSDLGKVFSDCGLEYKIERRRNVYVRLHRKGDSIPEGEERTIRNGWRAVFSFRLTPTPFEHFHRTMQPIYVDPMTSPYFTEIDVVRYFSKDDMIAVKDDCVIISSMRESEERTFSKLEAKLKKLYSCEFPSKDMTKDMEEVWIDGNIRKVRLKCSYSFLAKVIMHFFPMIPDYETEKAVDFLLCIEYFEHDKFCEFFPIGESVQRMLKKNMVLSGYHLPEGTCVDLNGNVLLRDPDYFEDPDTFKPERWLRTAEWNPANHPYVPTPFSMGTRMCAGRRFAEQDLYIGLCRILLKYQLTASNDQAPEQEWAILLRPKTPLPIRFHRR